MKRPLPDCLPNGLEVGELKSHMGHAYDQSYERAYQEMVASITDQKKDDCSHHADGESE